MGISLITRSDNIYLLLVLQLTTIQISSWTNFLTIGFVGCCNSQLLLIGIVHDRFKTISDLTPSSSSVNSKVCCLYSTYRNLYHVITWQSDVTQKYSRLQEIINPMGGFFCLDVTWWTSARLASDRRLETWVKEAKNASELIIYSPSQLLVNFIQI